MGVDDDEAAAMPPAAPAVDDEVMCWPPWPSAITVLPGDGNMVLDPFLLLSILSLSRLSLWLLLCFAFPRSSGS